MAGKANRVVYHVSYFMYLSIIVSPYRVSCIVYRASRLPFHSLRALFSAVSIVYRLSCLLYHLSVVISHLVLIVYHVSFVLCRASCLLYGYLQANPAESAKGEGKQLLHAPSQQM